MECILPFTKQVSAIGEREFPATFLQRKTETEKNGQMVRQFSVDSFQPAKEEYLRRKSKISGWNFRKVTIPFTFQTEFSEIFAKW